MRAKRLGVFLINAAQKKPHQTNLTGGGMEIDTDVFSRKQTAKLLGISLTSLQRLDIPQTIIGHRVMYKRGVIGKWLDEHTEQSDGEAKEK